ncbi:nucleoside triphosphate pyrophosphohydrolase [Litorimonas sp.]|uniref:nucleoside triphosphate pyrophosphohydrolase n=1 Tax=Litorimonas sp. TaxID=1892381 RepID=UPI003A8A883C
MDSAKAKTVSGVKGETPYERVKDLMERLRAECPWDREQSFESIAPYTIEEAYEVADAIEQNDMGALREELGDLLLQVVFHSKLADETGAFNLDDVTDDLVKKMVRRHPHVFGEENVESVPGNWEKLKEAERTAKGHTSRLDGVALSLPALMRAQKLQKRAAKTGFDWPDLSGVWDKIEEEISEVKEAVDAKNHTEMEEEIGDLLFSVVNLSRKLGVDSEVALRRANAKFSHRFRGVESRAGASIQDLDLETLESYWQDAKSDDTK